MYVSALSHIEKSEGAVALFAERIYRNVCMRRKARGVLMDADEYDVLLNTAEKG